MPAARPSQASVANAVSAAMDAGLIPASICVAPDGSFRIELSGVQSVDQLAISSVGGEDNGPPTWSEISEG